MNDAPSSCLLLDRYTFFEAGLHSCSMHLLAEHILTNFFPQRILCCLHQPLCHPWFSGISSFISRQPLAVRALVQCICLLCSLSVVASLFSFENLHFRRLRRAALHLRLNDKRIFRFIACGILASASKFRLTRAWWSSLAFVSSQLYPSAIMDVGEVAKVFLFIIQWIWTACVAFIFPGQLIDESPLKSSSAKVCLFDRQQDLSRCNFGMAWGLLALFILTGTLIWYSLNFCTSIRLPPNLEVVVFAWLALWWVRDWSRLPYCLLEPWIEGRLMTDKISFYISSTTGRSSSVPLYFQRSRPRRQKVVRLLSSCLLGC